MQALRRHITGKLDRDAIDVDVTSVKCSGTSAAVAFVQVASVAGSGNGFARDATLMSRLSGAVSVAGLGVVIPAVTVVDRSVWPVSCTCRAMACCGVLRRFGGHHPGV
jgi:hypothetical protein